MDLTSMWTVIMNMLVTASISACLWFKWRGFRLDVALNSRVKSAYGVLALGGALSMAALLAAIP